MGCICVGSITTTTQIILDDNQCTIFLVLVIPVIQSTYLFLSDTRALKILSAADSLNWSESESLYGWQSVSQSVCLGVEPTLWTFDQIASFSSVWVWHLLSCLCGAPSLTRGRVCPRGHGPWLHSIAAYNNALKFTIIIPSKLDFSRTTPWEKRVPSHYPRAAKTVKSPQNCGTLMYCAC
jgi:hypothetical protein